MRLLWVALYYGVVQFLPSSSFPGFAWTKPLRRSVVARFMKVASDSNIERRAYIGGGKGVSLGSGSGIGVLAQLHGAVEIGENVLMGPEVMIFARNHRFSDVGAPIKEQGYSEERPVKVGDDVWIGARAIILPGVHIGAGSIIGAGAVVSRSVEPYSVVVGNPARVVKQRA